MRLPTNPKCWTAWIVTFGVLPWVISCGSNEPSNALTSAATSVNELPAQQALRDYLLVGETLSASEFSTEEQSAIKDQLVKAFSEHPDQAIKALQPFTETAQQLQQDADLQQRSDLIEQLFTDLTHSVVLEYLAPNGTDDIPADPSALVSLSEQRLGDFSNVIQDLIRNGDLRGFIFDKRAPHLDDIDNAILSLHDRALTNKLATNQDIGKAFQSAAWSGF